MAGNSAFQENLREWKFTSQNGNPADMMDLRWLPASGPLAGHGGADYRVRETDDEFVVLTSYDSHDRVTGNTSLSQPGGAHAAGACPPRASITNRNLLMPHC